MVPRRRCVHAAAATADQSVQLRAVNLWAMLQTNCVINTLHIEAGRWAVVDWGSTGHLEGVGCLADAAGKSNSTVLIGSCGWHLQQRTRYLLLQVGPRQEDNHPLRINPPGTCCYLGQTAPATRTSFYTSHTALFNAMADGTAAATGRNPARTVSFSASQKTSNESTQRWGPP